MPTISKYRYCVPELILVADDNLWESSFLQGGGGGLQRCGDSWVVVLLHNTASGVVCRGWFNKPVMGNVLARHVLEYVLRQVHDKQVQGHRLFQWTNRIALLIGARCSDELAEAHYPLVPAFPMVGLWTTTAPKHIFFWDSNQLEICSGWSHGLGGRSLF